MGRSTSTGCEGCARNPFGVPASCRTRSGIHRAARSAVWDHAVPWMPEQVRHDVGRFAKVLSISGATGRNVMNLTIPAFGRTLRESVSLPPASVTPAKAGGHGAGTTTACAFGETWMPDQVRHDGAGVGPSERRAGAALLGALGRQDEVAEAFADQSLVEQLADRIGIVTARDDERAARAARGPQNPLHLFGHQPDYRFAVHRRCAPHGPDATDSDGRLAGGSRENG